MGVGGSELSPSADTPEQRHPVEPVAPQRGRLGRGLALAAVIGVSAGVAVAVLTGGRTTLEAAATLPLPVLGVLLALFAGSWLGESAVFAALAGRRRLRDVATMMPVYLGGGFPALATPFGSGGLPGWTWALTRVGLGAGEAAAVVGARALMTSCLFVALGAAAAVVVPARLSGSAGIAWWGLVVLLAVLAAAAVLALRPSLVTRPAARAASGRLMSRLLGADRARGFASAIAREGERFAESLRELIRHRPGDLALALGGLVFSRACLLAMLPTCLWGLGWRGDPVPVMAMLVGVWVVSSGSPTPGGSGAAEAAMAGALATVAPPSTAGAAALLWRGLTYYLQLVLGWVMLSRLATRPTERRARDS